MSDQAEIPRSVTGANGANGTPHREAAVSRATRWQPGRRLRRLWTAVTFAERRLRDPAVHDDRFDSSSSAVVDAACALVTGRAAEGYVADGRTVPYWAWVNALAHRPHEAVVSLAIQRPEEPWAWATVAIAAELERLEPEEVSALRAAVFAPAELDALARRGGSPDAVLRSVRRHAAAARQGRTRTV
ncbi:MAG: hypothetical protein M0Z95_14025 [Actinomycetota bacterium]|jgi:hypothetical protein|nr:hypothetical protein [Actinomycetota bacterium]